MINGRIRQGISFTGERGALAPCQKALAPMVAIFSAAEVHKYIFPAATELI